MYDFFDVALASSGGRRAFAGHQDGLQQTDGRLRAANSGWLTVQVRYAMTLGRVAPPIGTRCCFCVFAAKCPYSSVGQHRFLRRRFGTWP